MGIMRSRRPRGPSAAELQRREEAARQRERERIAQEQAAKKAEQEQKAVAEMEERERKRKAFAGGLTTQVGSENDRKKFLKGA